MVLNSYWMDIISPCSYNDVFDSPCDLKSPIITNIPNVTSMEKAFDIKYLEVLLLTTKVSHEHISALDANLSSTIVVRIKNLYLCSWQRFPVLVKLDIWKFLVSDGT